MEHEICPWCQTEITWDEEIGPETICPHCANELGNYRTLNVDLAADEDELDDEETELLEELEQQGVEEGSECSWCGETTVRVGEQTIDKSTFVPTGVLAPPFHVDVFLCPSCMQMQFVLAERSRQQLKKPFDGGEDR